MLDCALTRGLQHTVGEHREPDNLRALTQEASPSPALLGFELQEGVEMAGNVESSGQCWAFFIS